MNFDIQTLSIMVAVSSVVFAFSTITVARTIPSEKHLMDWAWGAGLTAASTFLVGLRGIIPDFISTVIANTLLAFGFIVMYRGSLGMFDRQKFRNSIWLVGVAAFVALAWFTLGVPDVRARVIVLSLVAGPMLLLVATAFFQHDRSTGPNPLRIANRITVVICLLGAFIFFVRMPLTIQSQAITSYTVSNSFLFVAPYLWAILFNVWLSITVTLHANSKLLADLSGARDEAQANNIAKSQFLANMSHEIRTPMNAILGMLKLLGHTELKANQFDYVSKTENAAKSLLSLLNDILDFSKMDANKMELDIQPFKTEQLMQDLAVVLSANVGSKSIDVLYDIDPDVPQVLIGDSMRLQQVLINLAGNAVKFTTSGQVVVILRCDHATPSAQPGWAEIEFVVKDSGIGIAPEHQAKIFTGFSQAEASTTRQFGGTGLGLSISRKLIALMGGEIGVSSQLGQGSTFSFKLRLAVPEATPGSATEKIGPQHRTVLIIDDNPVACQLLGKMVRNLGWSVYTTASASQAGELIEQRNKAGDPPFSLAYVDWHMPEGDGWQTIKTLQQLCRSLKISAPGFVLMSANGRENLAQRTLQEQDQLQAFLAKPFTTAMLLAAGTPQADDQATLRRAARASKRQLSGMRILVVEDNAINQQVAEELLTFEGALVSIAANGRLGVNAVASAKKQFDAVLMDVQMLVMDGYAATQAIRQQLGLAQLPIIGLTANAMAGDREACIKAGMNEHIGKPFDMEQLVSMLIRLTGRVASPNTLALSGTTELANPDIELGAALQRLGGMRSLYVRAAGALQLTLQGLHAQLQQHLSDGDMPQVCTLLHTTKGNAATLGLTPLSQELERLEKLCKAQMPAQELSLQTGPLERKIASAQTALVQAIAVCSDEPSTGTSGQTSTAARPAPAAVLLRVRSMISEQLLPMLMASDLGALTVFAEHRSDFESLPAADVDTLETALQDLDFAAAIAVCNRLLSEN